MEIEEPEMEETPEWLEEDEHADDLGEEATPEEEWGEEEEEDVPLPEDTEVEEEIHLPVQRAPPPPPRRVRATTG